MATVPKDPPRVAVAPSARVAPDYLERLSDQAVSGTCAPALLPRIASRFEPTGLGDARDDTGLREVDAWVDAGADPTAAALAADVEPAPRRPRVAARARDRVARDAPPRAIDATVPDEGHAPPSPLLRVSAASLESPRAIAQKDDAQRTIDAAARDRQTDERTPARPATTPVERTLTDVIAHSPDPVPATGRRLQLGAIERLDAPSARRLPDVAPDAQVPHAATERSLSAREVSAPDAERSAAAAPPPIEIYIDRIDVRGLAPPVHVHHAPPAAPARAPTSLDELLRRRRGEPA